MVGAEGGADPGAGHGWRWDVALSFAGAQRAYVHEVAEALRARGVRCFYDADEEIELWGKYLAEELPTIYGEQAAAVVVFVSADYAAGDWTRHERRAALGRAVRERREYVLPARFDDTALPGLLSDMVWVDLRTRTPKQFASMIIAKLTMLGIAIPGDEGVAGLDGGAARPAGAVRVDAAPPGEPMQARDIAGLALSPDVQDAYRRVFMDASIPVGLPVSWTLPELSEMRRQVAEATRRETDATRGASEVAVTLTALCDALEAKPVFLAIGGRSLGIDRLQVTYRHEIGAWPRGGSADALLVEAASAGIVERRDSPGQPLGALARFVVGIAAVLERPPDGNDLLGRWIDSLGHQLADAQQHYTERREDPAWLLIELGDEPLPGQDFWPTKVIWTRVGPDGPLTGDPIACEPNQDDLKRALGEVLRLAPRARPLLVDLAVPRALMDFGVEHWEIGEVDGVAEPLSADYHPRLRWSKRRHDEMLLNRVRARLATASWRGEPRQWLENDPRRACFVGGTGVPPSAADPLRAVLRDGCAFVIWFRAGLPDSVLRQVTRAVRKIPVQARRRNLPDYLPAFSEDHPVIIWDDPGGRGGFHLPPTVKPQSP